MTTKNMLLALAAASLLAFGAAAPVYAEDPPPAGEGMKSEVPADPDSMAPADANPDPGADQGAGTDSKMDGAAKDGGGDAPDAAAPKDGGATK